MSQTKKNGKNKRENTMGLLFRGRLSRRFESTNRKDLILNSHNQVAENWIELTATQVKKKMTDQMTVIRFGA